MEWNESSMRTLSKLPLLTTLVDTTKLSRRFPLPQVKEMELYNRRNKMLVFGTGCCVNVTELTVSGTTDLTSLVRCFPKLEVLKFLPTRPDIRTDPSPLKNLTRLKQLNAVVHPSKHATLAFLAEMDNLQSLELNTIGDLSLLRSMKGLRELALQSVPSRDISILAELT